MTNVNYGNSGRVWSTSLWGANGGCPVAGIRNGSVSGVYQEDDFADFNLPGTQTSEIVCGKYKVYNTGAGTVVTAATLDGTLTMGGHITMLCDTDGDASAIATQACPFLLSGLDSNSGKLWGEFRIRLTGIATNNVQLFVGLGENSGYTLGAAKPLGNANAVATDVPFFGFQITEDGLGVVNVSYADEAATWTNAVAGLGTLTAATYANVGFTYDPSKTSDCLAFYFNGAKSTTYMSRSTLTGLTNLDVSPLGFLFATFADSAGTSTYAACDRYRIYQLTP